MSREHYSLPLASPADPGRGARLLSVASARYGGDWHSVPHTHNHVELFYIVGGRGQFQIENRRYPVSADHMVIINSGVLHTELSLDANPLEYIVLGIDGVDLALGDGSDGMYCIVDFGGSNEVAHCLRSIMVEMEGKQAGYEEVCQAFMRIVLIRINRRAALSVPQSPPPGVSNPQCAAVRRYIDQHFKEPLTLEHLSGQAHMNKYYLSHTFKREYGVSPIRYMISRRLEESKYLLKETDLSLSQIAQMLGFSSLSYFSQVFRRTQGQSPLEYRNSQRSGQALSQS